MIRDNDQTKNVAQPAVIVAAIRSGGTFLTHCLSNHSQIACDRGEPIHHLSVWCRMLKRDRRKILAVLLNQTGYMVSMCRLTYIQAFNEDIWAWLIRQQPWVIWLYRENILRQAISVHLNRLVRDKGQFKRPAHTFKQVGPVSVEVAPAHFLKMCRGLDERNRWAEKRLTAMRRVERLTYAEVVGGEMAVANQLPTETTKKICNFLGVRYEPLGCDLRRVNPYPLSELIGNWADVERAIKGSEFAELLESL
jgi:hypothetical protein